MAARQIRKSALKNEESQILAAICRGEAAADSGKTTPHKDVKKLLESWIG